jgi:alpha 1,3-glucosidase
MPLTLKIFLDHNETAKGYIYLDDGISFDYQNGHYIYLKITYSESQLLIEDMTTQILSQDHSISKTDKYISSVKIKTIIVKNISSAREFNLIEGIKIGERGLKTTIKLND